MTEKQEPLAKNKLQQTNKQPPTREEEKKNQKQAVYVIDGDAKMTIQCVFSDDAWVR